MRRMLFTWINVAEYRLGKSRKAARDSRLMISTASDKKKRPKRLSISQLKPQATSVLRELPPAEVWRQSLQTYAFP